MATRRMFSQEITDSDAFADMPLSAQALYFHLGMAADDDGFVNNARKIQRGIGASNDDLMILCAKNFIIPFDSGVVAIKHWKVNNSIKNDRYRPTKYLDELGMLETKDNKVYTLIDGVSEQGFSEDGAGCLQDGSKTEPEIRLGKVRLEEKDKLSGKPDRAAEYEEVVGYLNAEAGTQYRPTTKATQRLINARLSEGYGLSDFHAVIAKKSRDWRGDPKMARYLRPETLFGTKFEGYLQEAKAVSADDARYAKYD